MMLLYGYFALSLAIALWLVARGIDRLDEKARGAGWAFRLFLVPGAMILWPVLVRRLR